MYSKVTFELKHGILNNWITLYLEDQSGHEDVVSIQSILIIPILYDYICCRLLLTYLVTKYGAFITFLDIQLRSTILFMLLIISMRMLKAN